MVVFRRSTPIFLLYWFSRCSYWIDQLTLFELLLNPEWLTCTADTPTRKLISRDILMKKKVKPENSRPFIPNPAFHARLNAHHSWLMVNLTKDHPISLTPNICSQYALKERIKRMDVWHLVGQADHVHPQTEEWFHAHPQLCVGLHVTLIFL